MPQDLPGFYFDAEKNRYFPNKGPVPGSRRSTSTDTASSSSGAQNKVANSCKRKKMRTSSLLQAREVYGNLIATSKRRCNFKEEFQKAQASHPVVWKYQGTNKLGDGALERVHFDVQTEEGLIDIDFLLAGGAGGSFSIFELGKLTQGFDFGMKCLPDCVWPLFNKDQVECRKVPGQIWSPAQNAPRMPSRISCIKTFSKQPTEDDNSSINNALVSTLGSENRGGSLYVINLSELLDRPNRSAFRRNIVEIATFQCTIWTADCKSDGSRLVIGTNKGASLVDLETGRESSLLCSKSDVLAQQLFHSGNVVLCGLRNGAILTVDVRQKQDRFSAAHARHRMPHLPFADTHGKSSKQSVKLSGKMPSSIACLVSLKFDDQYFLASSMDGTVKLYDHRIIQRGAVKTYEGHTNSHIIQRGAVQSYEGHANSHTRLELGVDPSERFVISGGEDCNLRLWSIKSGELLFEDKFSKTVTPTVCWQKTELLKRVQEENQSYDDVKNRSLGAWVGSAEGIYYMDWEL